MRRASFSSHLTQPCLRWGLLSRRLYSNPPLWWQKFTNEVEQEYVDEHTWKEEKRHTLFAKALCTTKLKSVSELAVDSKLEKDLVEQLEAQSPNLLFLKINARSPFQRGPLQPVSDEETVTVIVRDPIKHAYDEFLDKALVGKINQCLIIGAAGIGKSFNALYLARRLMEKKKLFVFHHRGSQVLAFVPPRDDSGKPLPEEDYTVYETPAKDFDPLTMPALKSRDNFLIFDPAEKQGEAPWDVNAAVVSPSSPNLAHYTQFVQQPADLKCKFYVPPFSLADLETCFHLGLLPKIRDLDELRTRFFFFGGSLRKINVSANNRALEEEKKKILGKVNELPSDVVESLFFASETNEIDTEVASARYSSRLWSYYPEDGDPLSARAGAASEFVQRATLQRHYNTLAYAAGMRKQAYGAAAASPELEKFCGVALSVVGNFRVRELRNDTTAAPVETFAFPVELPIKRLPNFNALWKELKLSDPTKPSTLYATSKTNEPVVDFVSAADIAFQVTGAIAGDHTIAVQSMLKILDETKAARGGAKLRLYLVVPESEFDKAKAQPFAHSKETPQVERDRLEAEINQQMEQWVLAIPPSLEQGNIVKTVPHFGITPVSKKKIAFPASMGRDQRISAILEVLNDGEPETLRTIGPKHAAKIKAHHRPFTSLKELESLLGTSAWEKFLSSHGLDKSCLV